MEKDNFETLIGEFTYVLYKSDSYMVCKYKTSDGTITVTGPFFEYENGQIYELIGNYVDHPKYGFQFSYIKINKHLSTNKDQIISFLSSTSFKGIGKKTAEKIYDFFKEDTLHILKQDCQRIYDIELTEKQYKGILNGFASLNDPQNEIMFYLLSSGFNSLDAQKIFNRFKLTTIEISNINPFRFYNEVYGISFEKVKKFAYSIDFENKEDKFKESYLIYLLNEYCFEYGDTYIDYDLFKSLSKLGDFDDVVKMNINHNYFVLEDNRIYLYDYYYDEKFIADYLKGFNNELILDKELIFEGIENNENSLHIKYDSKQKQAIQSFFESGISIIVGGPGTGKTTIVKTMVNMFKTYFPFNNLIALAPTGRAAKRISEVCDCEAKTIHSLLRWNLETNTFIYDLDNPILYDTLIIDEFSMVDSNLFSSLLKASKFVKKICIIGDDNQLPSIKPGFVLGDLIESKMFSVTKLDCNYRQNNGNEIIDLADSIMKNTVNLSKYNQDIKLVDYKKQNVDLVSMIKNDLNNGCTLDEIQVLTPMHRGEFGIDNLNIMLQSAFNPSSGQTEKTVGKYTYRVNDKILQLKNRPNDDVYNGDIGTLIEINDDDKCFIVNFNGVFVFYDFQELSDISLAYAMSVHKAQGSEYRVVYFILSRSNIHMLNKNLIYTAISRAKTKLVIIGEESLFLQGLSLNMRPRNTTLCKCLINCD